MKLYLKLLLSIFIIMLSMVVSGQTLIRGTVTDSEDNSRIIGATVTEYDQDRRVVSGTITDFNGNYNFRVKNPSNTIIVSYIGYESYEFTIDGREVIDVQLESSSIQMDEVVITAESGSTNPLTGVAQRDITGSQTRIDMSETRNLGATSADEALQGQVSGLDIVSSGNPGGGSQIVIRGLGSLGSSKPLIVVDNIPQDIRVDNTFDFASADQEDIGSLVNISPQDIKSIDVLKDAASTAVWGSKGADGVLLITTQRGRRGKTQFEYTSRYTINEQPPPIPMLNGDEYIMMQLEQWHNAEGLFDIPPELSYSRDYADFYNYNKNTDWVEAISQTGFISDQYFKISGGGDKTRYFASVNYQNNLGTTINTSLKRLSTRINLDYKLSSKIKFSVNFNYTNSIKEDNYPIRGRNVRAMAYIKAPNMSIWEYDGNGNPTGEYFTPIYSYQGNGNTFFNPVAVANLSVNDRDENQVENSFVFDYNITPWLRFMQTLSFQYLNAKTNQYLPGDAIGTDWLDYYYHLGNESNQATTRVLSRSQLFFIPRIKNPDHTFSGILMTETEASSAEWSGLNSSRNPGGNIKDPAANAVITGIYSGSNEARGIGFFGSVNYKFRDRYILSANLRMDGSSKFGTNQRWGLFPSIMGGWRFSEEEIFNNFPALSNGKLRASWGMSGKQPGSAYDRHAIFNTSNPNQYIEDAIIIQQQVQLENLKWQTLKSWNVGIDLGFLKDRITLTGDIYNKITRDILWSNYKIPKSSGYTLLKWHNGGMLQNKGWEFSTRVIIIRKNKFLWNVNFNISSNKNSFLEFPENFNNEVATTLGNGQYPRRADIGQPIGSFYGFRYLGVWASDEDVIARDENGKVLRDVNGDPIPFTYNNQYTFVGGDAIYEDINHDGNIDLLDVVLLGDSNPDFIGGFGSNVRWKQFRFSAQFHYRTGFKIVNEIAMQSEGMLDRNNQSKAVLHRWRIQGQDEPDIIPRAYMNHPANNLGSDRYVEDGDFLRLNSVTFSYDIPRKVATKLHLNSLEFAFTMRKIYTLTKYTGQDPEIPAGDDPFWFGTDKARAPTPKGFVLSLSLGF